jgi:hypothetical protein
MRSGGNFNDNDMAGEGEKLLKQQVKRYNN